VSRLPDAELARKRAKESQRPGSRAARVAGQQLEQEGRRRRRRRSRGAGEAETEVTGGEAEEQGVVDATEPVLEAMAAEDAAIDAEAEAETESPAEEAGIVDVDEAAVEVVEEITAEAAEATDDTSPEGEEK